MITRRRLLALPFALAAAPFSLLAHEDQAEEPGDLQMLKERTAYHTELLMEHANKHAATGMQLNGHRWALQIHERRIRQVEAKFPGPWPRTDGGAT